MNRRELLSDLKFQVLSPFFGICRLNMEEDVPEWVLQSHWHCLTRTAEEVSVVCEASAIPAFDREAGEDWLSHILTVPYEWIIEWEGHCIGVARLTLTESDNRARYAVALFDSALYGKGLGTETTRLVLQYAFQKLKLHRVDLNVLT